MKYHFLILSFFAGLYANAQLAFARIPNQPAANMYSVVTDPTNGDIYACTTNIVIKSLNGGTTWSQAGNTGMGALNVLYFSAIGELYAGGNYNAATSLNGLTKYNKISNTWTSMTGSPINVTAIAEDVSGNLYAGTGTTSNTQPNPVNFGTGMYFYNGASWATINTGISNLSGYTVLPFIKDIKILSNGNIVAATYGNGVLKYGGGSWSPYGTGLSNSYVNCLYLTGTGVLYAGTDANVSMLSGTAWSISSAGITPNKPVRVLLADVSGTMYAGLSFYLYQKGSISGEIFYSTNNGALWQNATAGFNSTGVVSMAVQNSGTVYAAANGIWKAGSPNNWGYAMSSVALANNIEQMVKAGGYWFLICRNPLNYITGCAGVFRSADKGVTWTSVNNGINCQKIDVIFADSHDRLWLGTKEFIGASLNPAFGNPELYYSDDYGNTWIKENTIVTPTDGYEQIAEDSQGRVFVNNSFGGVLTNISSSLNHASFLNNLNPPPNNGGKSFGLAVTASDHILFGTETTQGLIRSVANGAPGSFISLATPGVGYAPNGNVSVSVDPTSGYIFCGGTHGVQDGAIIAKDVFASSNVYDGSNMFVLNNLPDYCSFPGAGFDNRGNGYFEIKTSNIATDGLYFASPPWNSNTVFTRMISGGTLSYYFESFMTDECGYMYGMGLSGGIYRSTAPLNTPAQSTLTIPANNSTGVILSPTLSWTHPCIPDSFRIQIATDVLFTQIVRDQSALTTTNYTVPGSLLPNTKYYWRVYGVNSAGTGKWSSVNNFTTTVLLSLTLLDFKASYKRDDELVHLDWTTVNETNTARFAVEKSGDGISFAQVGTVTASGQPGVQAGYYFDDIGFLPGRSFYRLKQINTDGSFTYSVIISIVIQKDKWTVFPNPVKDKCIVEVPDPGKIYDLVISNSEGKRVFNTNSIINQKDIIVGIGSLAPGIYYMRLTDRENGSSEYKKIIKD